MFQHFFHELRAAKVPVTLKEYLTLLEAMDKGVVGGDGGNEVQDFYFLSRAALVKDRSISTASTRCSGTSSRDSTASLKASTYISSRRSG